MNELLLSSKEIIDRAIVDYKPYAIVLMLSGGDDSLTAWEVCKYLQVPLTHIMHGVTGTGIQEATDHVRRIVANDMSINKPIYLEANAGTSYVDYVMRKGFFGVGETAHTYSYHVLKWTHFRRTVSQEIRHRKRNRNILFVNGARRLESENRKKTMINPIKRVGEKGSNIWVNIINEWDKPDCMRFIDCNKRSPVSIKICRSGECMCGTMQSKADRIEASLVFPKWGKWVDELEKVVREKHGWGWGEQMPKNIQPKQEEKIEVFQPMCVGCSRHFQENHHLFTNSY